MLAKTLDVHASAPVKLPSGDLSYIKINLATKVCVSQRGGGGEGLSVHV